MKDLILNRREAASEYASIRESKTFRDQFLPGWFRTWDIYVECEPSEPESFKAWAASMVAVMENRGFKTAPNRNPGASAVYWMTRYALDSGEKPGSTNFEEFWDHEADVLDSYGLLVDALEAEDLAKEGWIPPE